MFYLIDGTLGFMGDLFQPYPYQDRTANMIADNLRLPTLTAFNARYLLSLAVKLLDFPTNAAYGVNRLRRVLRHVISHNIVRALGRKHYSEYFHFMCVGKPFDFDQLALLPCICTPRQAIHAAIALGTTRIIHLSIAFDRTII